MEPGPNAVAAASGRTADLSRAHRVDVSPSGVVTVTGGKLTTYRRMAADAVDAVMDGLDERARLRVRRRCPTKRLRLRGANGYAEVRERGDGAWQGAPGVNRHLADRYGGEARVLLAMLAGDPSLAEPLVGGLPYLRAEAVYAVRYEMANGVEDVLSRRCRALLLSAERAAEAAETVATLIGPALGWSAEDAAREAAAFRALVANGRHARGATPTGRTGGPAEETHEPIG
jgi:glycerol-3-phosphate dehydrogenase